MNRIVIVSTAEDSERHALASLLREIFPECTIEIISRKTAGESPSRPDVDVTHIAGLPAINAISIIEVDQQQASAVQPELLALWQSIVDRVRR